MQAFLKTLAAILAATKKHAIPLTLTLSLTALFVVLYYTSTAPAYPNPASETSNSPATIAPDGQQTDDTVPNPYINAPAFVPIVNTSTEINVKGDAYSGSSHGSSDDGYYCSSCGHKHRGLVQHFNDDIIGSFFSQIGQFIGKCLSDLINGWIADSAAYISHFLVLLIAQTEIGVILQPEMLCHFEVFALCGLLASILCYAMSKAIPSHRSSAHRHNGTFLPLLFPVLVFLELSITLTITSFLFTGCEYQLANFDPVLASAIRGGILPVVAGLVSPFAPLLGGLGLGIVGGTLGEIFAYAGLFAFTSLTIFLVSQLIALIAIRSSQFWLLAIQMFSHCRSRTNPNHQGDYMRTFATILSSNIIWLLLLKAIAEILFSTVNPWLKVAFTCSILQLMIMTPLLLNYFRLRQYSPAPHRLTSP